MSQAKASADNRGRAQSPSEGCRARTCRRRVHMSARLIGRTRKQWEKVADRYHVATIEAVVPQNSSSTTIAEADTSMVAARQESATET
jgi:hypothetical protein